MTQEETFLAMIRDFGLDYKLTYYFNTGKYDCEHHYILRTSTLMETTNIGGFRDHFMAYAFHKGEFLGAWINHGMPGERQLPGKIERL